ncbi:MAG TPA: type II toxin-antitoxin system VapC family toxin [Nocardioidaceae bacterium]
MPVVDASVVVDWVAPDADPKGPAMRALLDLSQGEGRLLAPRLMPEEVSNALLTGVRRGRWDGEAADRAFAHLRDLPVDLVDTDADLDQAWELSRRYDEHPLYDLLYVAVARRLGEVLLTADRRLAGRLRDPDVRLVG